MVDLLIVDREDECFLVCFIFPTERFPVLHCEAPEDLASLRFDERDSGSLVVTERVELSSCPSVGAPSEEKGHL